MELVRFDAEERVDLPDMTAVSATVLSEFRRTVRGLLLGPDASTPTAWTNYIVRGFKVEAAAVPNSTVVVKLNPGGGAPLSFAIGAENLGARVDFGQLMGGDGMDGSLEGNATYTLDFTGQPVASYTVQMRFVYTDGDNNNRAFWDEGSVSEFVTATDTRILPTLELRLSGAPSAEWITLATVAWGGATIVAGNITDARTFALEGAAPFQKTVQNAGTGVPDFSRSTSRDAAGINEVLPALRAIMRQIQDLKGQSDTGEYDWFSRPYKPADPTGLLAAGLTKSLRSIDTVTYTVGDGVADFGDFNGASGINDCLAFIASIPAASLPNRIIVRVKGGSVAYTWSGQKAINSNGTRHFDLTIEVAADSSAVTQVFARPTITLAATDITAGQYMLTIGGGPLSTLRLRGLNVNMTGASSNRGMFAATGPIIAEDCALSMASPDVTALYVLRSTFSGKCQIDNCDISGRVSFFTLGASSTPPSQREHGYMRNTRMTNAQIVLHDDAAAGATTPDMVNGFSIDRCTLTAKTGTIYTGSKGLIDAGAAWHLYLTDVTGTIHGDEGGLSGYVRNSLAPFSWRTRGCTWLGGTTGSHAVNAVAGGTGWAVSVIGGTPLARDIHIDGTHLDTITSIDAGGILIKDASGWHVTNTSCDGGADSGAASASFTAVAVRGTAAAPIPGTLRGSISALEVGNWRNSAVNNLIGIEITDAEHIALNGCVLSGYTDDQAQTDPTAFGANMRALNISGQASHITVTGCVFFGWAATQATGKCVSFKGACMFIGCTWRLCGGYVAACSAGASGVNFTGCRVEHTVNSTNHKGFDVRSCGQAVVSGCAFNFTGAARDAIHVDTVGFVVMGNTTLNGDIRNTGAVAGRGYNEAGQNLNYLSGGAYV